MNIQEIIDVINQDDLDDSTIAMEIAEMVNDGYDYDSQADLMFEDFKFVCIEYEDLKTKYDDAVLKIDHMYETMNYKDSLFEKVKKMNDHYFMQNKYLEDKVKKLTAKIESLK